MLRSLSLGGAFVLGIAQEVKVDIGRAELGKFAVVAKDDDGDLRVCQDGEFMRLFEETGFALEIGDGSIAILLDGLDLDLLATHLCGSMSRLETAMRV